MHSQVRFRLAEALRQELDEFAERWVQFIRVNELVPLTDESDDEKVNRARLGFEVLANLLEGADLASMENVLRRIFHDWINSAVKFSDLLNLEDAFPSFILPQLDIEPDSKESDEFLYAINDFFNSDYRSQVLTIYLQVYEDIINKESSHTAYILAHFDSILELSAQLNRAETRQEILDGLPGVMIGLFESVIAVTIWDESADGLKIRSIHVMGEDVPSIVLENIVPARLTEVYNVGEARWIPETDLTGDIKSLLGIELRSTLTGCAIPIRPVGSEGVLVLMLVSSEEPGTLELSLSRVAAAECGLALDRVKGSDRLSNVNRYIKDILSLSRDTSWGTGVRDTAEMVLDYLVDLTGARTAVLLLNQPGASKPTITAWRDFPKSAVKAWEGMSKLPSLIKIPIKSNKSVLLDREKLEKVLAGKDAPPGLALSDGEALGILPLETMTGSQGVCLFVCPDKFTNDGESENILAVFARTAAAALATSRDYEKSLKLESLAEAEQNRARILQLNMTTRYHRSGDMTYWGHLQPAGELAGDVLVVRGCENNSINIWAADIAGRGASVAWSMMFIRQLLTELPPGTSETQSALADINTKLHDIESKTTPGIFATLIGIYLDQKTNTGRFSRAGAPGLVLLPRDGRLEKIDPDGMPVGLFPDSGVTEGEFKFEPGDKIVWASDGLLGIRNDDGKVWGEDGLISCILDVAALPARAMYEHILAQLGEFGADDLPRDDWTLLVVGHDPIPDYTESLPGSEKDTLVTNALKWLRDRKIRVADLVAMRLILGEAIRNAFEHGNNYVESAKIEIKLNVSEIHIHVRVRDEGGNLNEKVTVPHVKPSDILEDKGRGFLLIRYQSDHLWVDEDRGELNAVRILEEVS